MKNLLTVVCPIGVGDWQSDADVGCRAPDEGSLR